MNQALGLPGENKSKKSDCTAQHIFSEKDCSCNKQEELAQIVGQLSVMITKTQHIQNLNPGTRNSRQYWSGLGFCKSGVDNMDSIKYCQDIDWFAQEQYKNEEISRDLTTEFQITGNYNKDAQAHHKEVIERLDSESYFLLAEKRNCKSVMEKIQGKKKDDTLVGIIAYPKPKLVKDAAKKVLLCNEDEINSNETDFYE